MQKTVLSIDIGGSKLAVGLVADNGSVLCSETLTWPVLEAQAVLQTVIRAAKDMFAHNRDAAPVCMGVNIPGLADPDSGVWVEACFSGIGNIPIADILTRELGIPAYIDNDANNCALAEKLFGVCKETTDFIWLTVSNGCGAALFLNNRLYRGIGCGAGEIGHICVEETNGSLCGCGNRGCLEAQAAGPGILRRYAAECGGGAESAKEIAEFARAGSPCALEIFRKEGYYIGKALAAAVNTLSPQKVVIGGGVAGAFDLFYPSLMETLQMMTYRKASGHISIEKTGLGQQAALIGAAALALLKENITCF